MIFNFFFLIVHLSRVDGRSDFYICTGYHTIPFLMIHRFLKFKGKILILNFYLHAAGENQLLRKMLTLIFRDDIHIILQSRYEFEQYRKSYPLIHPYFIPYGQDEIQKTYQGLLSEDRGYIFSGGYTNRDYETLMKAAEVLPYRFVVVCSRLNRLPERIPQNVTVHREVSDEEFHSLMAKSRLIVLNLKDQVGSSGQMVALAGLSFRKPIIYAQNEAISHYFQDGKSGLSYLMRDLDDLKNKIEYLMKNDKIRGEIAEKGYQLYKNNFLEIHNNVQILRIILEPCV